MSIISNTYVFFKCNFFYLLIPATYSKTFFLLNFFVIINEPVIFVRLRFSCICQEIRFQNICIFLFQFWNIYKFRASQSVWSVWHIYISKHFNIKSNTTNSAKYNIITVFPGLFFIWNCNKYKPSAQARGADPYIRNSTNRQN